MILWGFFFCCCLFHFHRETLIHSEVHPWFLLVRPEPAISLLHQCCSFLAPLPGDANWAPLTLWEEWHLARRYSLFTPNCICAPCTPLRLPAGHCWSSCPGMVFSTCTREENIHLQAEQAHRLTIPCAGVHCRFSWLCIVCTGMSCYGPKRAEEFCIHDCLRHQG